MVLELTDSVELKMISKKLKFELLVSNFHFMFFTTIKTY